MWERTSCEVCGGTSADTLIAIPDYHHAGTARYAKDRFRIVRCPTCSHVYVADRLSRSELNDVYVSDNYRAFHSYRDPAGSEHLADTGRLFAQDIVRYVPFKPGMRLLEIGSSFGHLLYAARAAGFVVQGIEPGTQASVSSRERFGLQVAQTTIEDAEPGNDGFDVAVAISVFEHVFDIDESLSKVIMALRGDGTFYIEVPCYDSVPTLLYGPRFIVRQVSQKRGVFHPVEHVRFFTSRSMHAWLTRHFAKVHAVPDPRLGRTYKCGFFMRLASRILKASPTGNIVFVARHPKRHSCAPTNPNS